MARLLLRDLTPGTAYKIQLRAADGDSYSEWSRLFDLTTTSDTVPPDVPSWAVTDDWVVNGDTFVATWQAIDVGLQNNTDFDHYELELSDGTKSVVVRTNNTSYTLTFAQNRIFFGTPRATVYARVRTVDQVGNVSAWTSQKSATNPPPAAPSSITILAMLEAIKVDWPAVVEDDMDHYKLQVSTTSGSSGFTDIYNGPDLSFTHGTTMFLTDHWFRIYAVDKFGSVSSATTSGSIKPKSPFVQDLQAPNIPTGLSATLTNNINGIGAKADVSWTMSSPPTDLAGFNIRYRPVGSTFYSYMNGIDQADRSATLTLNQAYVNYEFQIQAYDYSQNYSGWSGTYIGVSPANPVPADVTGLTSVADNNAITYSWTAVADLDIKNYEVTFSTSPTFASGNITYKTGNATTLTVGGLTANTTYYARVRAVDTAGNTSASWSATDTRTTGTNPAASTSDGIVPGTPGAPSVVGRFNSLYVTWAPVTTNASSGPQNDTVTYEVHLSTTTGFTPNSGTKVTEVDATSALITNLPGTTTALSYGTPYYIKLVAKDRDGSSGVSAEGSASLSKIASNDVTSIGADLIVPGTGFAAALVINTGGSIQSSNWSSGTAGWKISPTGAEFNDSGSSIKVDALKAGTLGGSGGSGVINIGAGTSLIFNGGYLKSNTYTGTSQASNPSGAGFYLGDDGIRIDQGIVKAEAFSGGTFTAGTITIGAGGAISGAGGGFNLSSSGLTLPNGSVGALALNITTGGKNVVPNSGFEDSASSFYRWSKSGTFTDTIDTTVKRSGSNSLKLVGTTSGADYYYVNDTGFTPAPNTKYTASAWVYVTGISGAASGNRAILVYDGTNSAAAGTLTTSHPLNTWVRHTVTYTSAANPGNLTIRVYAPNGTVYWDEVQVEEGDFASAYSPMPGEAGTYTRIDGAMINTGAIKSTSNLTINGVTVSTWSIDTSGTAIFGNAWLRGNTIVGYNSAEGTGSYIKSYNYNGSVGWMIDASGNAFFGNGTFNGTVNASSGSFTGAVTATSGTFTGTVNANAGTFTNTITIGNAASTTHKIQSYNYNGSVGWMIDAAGNAFFANGTFNGTINASSGSFTGAVNATSGTFTGTINATSGNFSGTINSSATISGGAFDGNTVAALTVVASNNFGVPNALFGQVGSVNSITIQNTNPPSIRFYYSASGNNPPLVGIIRSVSTGGIGIADSGNTLRLTVDSGAVTVAANLNVNDGITANADGTGTGFIDGSFTTGTTTTASVNVNGRIIRTSSSKRYKSNIKPLAMRDAKKVLDLQSVTFTLKEEAFLGDKRVRYPGFIAEQVDDSGAKLWVNYDNQGRPDGVRYQELTAAHNMLIKELYAEIEALKEEVRNLKS